MGSVLSLLCLYSSPREFVVKHCGGALAIARLANAEIVMTGGIGLPPADPQDPPMEKP